MNNSQKHLAIINEFLAKNLGTGFQIHEIGGEPTPFNIDVASTGALAPMFNRITLSIGTHYFEEFGITKLALRYSYEHSEGGSNGYSVEYLTSTGQGVKHRHEFKNVVGATV